MWGVRGIILPVSPKCSVSFTNPLKDSQKLQISIYETFNTMQITDSHIYHRISVYVHLKSISTIPPAETLVQN